MTKVSVIVPVYNREDCISTCIDSLLDQQLDGIEIILVDDGSKDGSKAICEKYAASYSSIRFISQENAGVSAARNAGIKIATGEYIAFCDSDDWVDKNAYSEIHEIAVKYNADLTVFGFYNEIFNYKDHVTIENKFNETLHFDGKKEIGRAVMLMEMRSFFEAPWNKLFKAGILKGNGLLFDPSLTLHEDFIFNLEFVKRISSCVITDKAYYHIVGRDRPSLSKQIVRNPIETIVENFSLKASIIKEFGIEDRDFHRYLEEKQISAFSGVLPSIYRRGGELSTKDRRDIIKILLRQLKGKKMDTTTFQGKVSFWLFKTRWPFFIDMGNSVLAKLRYSAPGAYIKIRNYFNRSHIAKLQKSN